MREDRERTKSLVLLQTSDMIIWYKILYKFVNFKQKGNTPPANCNAIQEYT